MKRGVDKSLLWLILSLVCLHGVGCGPMPGEKKMIDVKAQYLGLADQRVAVLTSADPHLLHDYPKAPLLINQAITSRIAKNVPGVTTTIPDEIDAFQKQNPYWMNMRYSELAEKLGVDRVVLIDMIEYQTHEPGNAYIWQGLITANIGVIDADARDPDNFVFQNTVEARFPQKSDVGLIDSDNDSIQLGLIFLFSQRGGGLFYDHQVEADK
ncbi:MAG: hypothetical protein R3C45_14675 [Phycisphaerales bacterium]